MDITVKQQDNFFNKIDITIYCWLWTGWKNGKGYGSYTVNHKKYRAHRFIYEFFYGAIPKGLLILHDCDNPSCVYPGHLYAGTHKDNSDDMVNRGRCPVQGWNDAKAKPVVIDGVVYSSISRAANKLGICNKSIRDRIKFGHANTKLLYQ